jgi:hypothetical protein
MVVVRPEENIDKRQIKSVVCLDAENKKFVNLYVGAAHSMRSGLMHLL